MHSSASGRCQAVPRSSSGHHGHALRADRFGDDRSPMRRAVRHSHSTKDSKAFTTRSPDLSHTYTDDDASLLRCETVSRPTTSATVRSGVTSHTRRPARPEKTSRSGAVAQARCPLPILTDKKPRRWQIDETGVSGITPAGYFLGGGTTPLEVALADARGRPAEADIRRVWKKRKGNTPSPLLLIVRWSGTEGDRASVCGPMGDNPPVYSDRDLGQVERIAASALAEPDHHTASRFLAAYLPDETGALRNLVLFSTHHLVERVPQRSDWPHFCTKGERLLSLRRDQLMKALGFTVESRGQAAVLRSAGNARALAVFLDDGENPDATSGRFNSMTPVSWAIASAAADNIPYVVMTRGPQLRIYTTRTGATPGRKGGTSVFLEVNLALLTAEDAGYVPLLFSAESLSEGGKFEALLAESHDYAVDLGSRLRSRVYDHAVPAIAEALIARHKEVGGEALPRLP